jgi:hypothetical protein
MADLSTFDLSAIASALSDQNDYESAQLVHSQTGEMVYWSRDSGIDGHNPIDIDDLDEALVGIRPLPSWEWYQDMADFIDEITDEQAGRRLARAIDGKGRSAGSGSSSMRSTRTCCQCGTPSATSEPTAARWSG